MATTKISTGVLKDGSVTSAKLDTNISIVGDLTVDTNTLFVDSASNNVGIGTSSPSNTTHIYKNASLGSPTSPILAGAGLQIQDTNNSMYFDGNAIVSVGAGNFEIGAATTSMKLITNGAERMIITSAGNVGIGTDSPAYPLTINTGAGTFSVRPKGGSSVTIASSSSLAYFGDTHEFSNSAGTSESMRIDSSGNVGIGTSSIGTQGKLYIVANGVSEDVKIALSPTNSSGGPNPLAQMGATANGTYGSELYFTTRSTGGTVFERMRITSSGNVGIGTSSPSSAAGTSLAINGGASQARLALKNDATGDGSEDGLQLGVGTDGGAFIDQRENNYMILTTNAIERMRITSTGNVGIGTSTPSDKLEIAAPFGQFRLRDTDDSSFTQFSSSSNKFAIRQGSTTANHFFLDSIGNVGIGTSSPTANLHIKDSSSSSDIIIEDSTGNTKLYLQSQNGIGVLGTITNYPLRFDVNDTERMRIDSSGNVLINGTSKFNTYPSGFVTQSIASSSGDLCPILELVGNRNAGVGNQNGMIQFWNKTSTAVEVGRIASIQGSAVNSGDLQFITSSLGTGAERMRLEADGDLHVDGDVIAYSTTISDQRLKEDVQTIDNALDKVCNLRGVSYTWNNGSRKGQKDLGLIAQEVEQVLPELVREKEMPMIDGGIYKTVDYEKIVGVLIEAVKELKAEVESLKSK
jgi:trimeric autotransporter adhesin